MKKYYEVETPIVRKTEKNVIKLYPIHGKLQVFPRVKESKYGIGRGATLDFQMFELNELKEVKNLLNQLVDLQIDKLEGKEMA